MSAMAPQITNFMIVYPTVYSRRRSKKTSKLRVTGLFEENPPVTFKFQTQAHAHHTHEAHRGPHWYLQAKSAWNLLLWNVLSSYLM